jgi:flagellar protein FlgJ
MTQISGTYPTTMAASAPLAAGPGPASATAEREALAKAAKAFEAIFMRQLLGSMRQASLGEGIADSGAVDQFREMADARMAEGLADQGNLGIANLLLRQLERKP